jgi:hypothetical protein
MKELTHVILVLAIVGMVVKAIMTAIGLTLAIYCLGAVLSSMTK